MPNTGPERKTPSSSETGKIVHVCVAVIERRNPNNDGIEVLIAKRPDHVHQGGLWEFPGGKVEPEEALLTALDRELYEELGIRLHRSDPQAQNTHKTATPLIQIRHAYPDKTVLLDVWKVSRYAGEAFGKEGQTVRWVALSELSDYPFPEANLPIILACLLPNRYFITPAYPSLLSAEQGLRQALNQGAQLIYFRQPQLDSLSYEVWLRYLVKQHPELKRVLMRQYVDNLRVMDLSNLQSAGVHLSFRAASVLNERPVEKSMWFAVSCHNAAELAHASKLDADFVTLSPVLKTPTHPEQPEMGWALFSELVREARQPVFGLGGLSAEHEAHLKTCGAQGLAGIGFWQ